MPKLPVSQPRQIPWALAALSLSMLLSSLGTSIANVALPTLAEVFSASFQQVQWVVLTYLLAITTLIVSVGRLGDIFGRRRLLLGGILVFTIASVLCAAAPTLDWLLAARVAQGLGAATMMALTMAFVAEIVPKDRTGSAMGLLGTMSAVGTALGPSLSGVLIGEFGWRCIFLVNLPLGMLAFLLAQRYLPADRQSPQTHRARFDAIGTLLLALSLAAYALATTLGRGHFGLLNIALLLAAAIASGLFMYSQTQVASPLVRLAAFHDPALGASLAINVLVATVMATTFVVGPFYLSRSLGLSATAVGMVMAVGPAISIVGGVLAGRVVDRWGAAPMVVAGLAAMVAGAAALSLLPAMFGVVGYVVAIAILTPGYQLFQAANNTAVMVDVSADQRGVISGLLNLSRNLGLITGASVMGAVFAFGASTTDITTASADAVATGLRTTFAVAALLVTAALAIAVASKHRAETKKAPGQALF